MYGDAYGTIVLGSIDFGIPVVLKYLKIFNYDVLFFLTSRFFVTFKISISDWRSGPFPSPPYVYNEE